MNQETRQCQNCKIQFTIEPEDFVFYGKIKVPAPTFCPQCRLQRRLAFRNERSLYKRKCDLCKGDIIAMYSPDKPFPVYCPSCFHSDKWDPLTYGRKYNFSRPFFAQWQELQRVVPHLALFQENVVGSPWVNYEMDVKNCYLDIGGHHKEDCAYNQYVFESRDSLDNFWLSRGEFAYENIFSEQCYRVFFSTRCIECRDTYFSLDCRNCSNIFGCVGLRNKQYYIFNQPVGKEAFEKFLRERDFSSHQSLAVLKDEVRTFYRTVPQRAVFIDTKSINSTGHLITASKNCRLCWNVEDSENIAYGFFAIKVRDAMDITSTGWAERLYETTGAAEQLFNIRFTMGALRGSRDIEYSDLLFNCTDCFGCVNMKNKRFCVLNMQYKEEGYRALVSQVRRHMDEMPYTDRAGRVYKYGEFFPYELSPFDYNEAVANEYFPLTKEAAEQKGFPWSGYESESRHSFSEYAIPDRIADVKDDILEKVLKCEVSGKAYRLIPMELAFYRKMGLPIPRVSPFGRHRIRLRFITDHMALRSRTCPKCGANMPSVYTEEEYPIVYCERCYQNEAM